MEAIWQKLKADVVGRGLVSVLIAVTLAVAATLLTLALATMLNLSAPYDRSFEELNGAHLWLYFDRDLIRRRDIEQIESLPGVAASTGLQYSISSRVQLGDTRAWVSLRVTPLEPPTVNRLLVQEGRYLAPRSTEILGSKDLKDLYGLMAGDEIGVTRWDGKKVSLPVIGLAYNPMWDTYRNTQPPYLYVSEETMRELYPDQDNWDWSIGLRLADPESVDGILAQIKDMLRTDAIVTHSDWRDVKRSAVFGARLNLIFLGAFSLFAVFATVLVITSSISSTVMAQFRQIGILKAVGFSQNQILSLYVGQYLVLAWIASPLGLALGIVLSPLPLKSVAASLSATFRPPLNLVLMALVMSAVPGVVILATLASAYRGARANIVKAIAVGAEAPRKKPSALVRLATRLGLPMVFILGLNDVVARPFRSFLTGLSLTLGVIGIVFGLALNETLQTYRTDPSLLGIVHDAMVTRVETSDSQTRRVLSRAPGVEAFYGQCLVDADTLDGKSFQVRAVEGNLAAFPFRISEGRFFQPGTDEAIAGQGLLDWLNLEVGDSITLIFDDRKDRPVTWQIVGQYPEPVNVGQMMMVSLPILARWVKDADPRTYYLKLSPNADPVRLKKYLEPKPDADLNLTLVGQAIPSVVIYLQMAIFALAAIVIGIALVNVFNTSLLAMQEKVRTIGVLKTVGMTPAQVMAMINTAAGFLGLMAAGVGIPGGFMFTKMILTSLSAAYGFGEVRVTFSPLYVLALPPLIVAVSMVGSWFPSRRAARLSIVTVLRNE